MRDGYLQRRRNQVYDGNPPPVKEEDWRERRTPWNCPALSIQFRYLIHTC
jgi:hypothetical protein